MITDMSKGMAITTTIDYFKRCSVAVRTGFLRFRRGER
jgi:hypothetical protein